MRLHKFVYLAVVLGSLHYFWMVKADIRLPLVHASILTILLSVRAGVFLKKINRHRIRTQTSPCALDGRSSTTVPRESGS